MHRSHVHRGCAERSGTKLTHAQGIENKRTKDLSEEELTQLREEVDHYVTEGDLRRAVNQDIKRLKDIGCYRGRRHINVSLHAVIHLSTAAMVYAGGL